MCIRDRYILYYFGEQFDPVKGDGAQMCDNSVNPPTLKDATKELKLVLKLVKDLEEKFKTKDLISVIVGKENPVTKSYKLESTKHFGIGKTESENFWKSIIRQATVQNFLQKDIETYGVLKITEKGQKVIDGKNKNPFLIAEDKDCLLYTSRCV